MWAVSQERVSDMLCGGNKHFVVVSGVFCARSRIACKHVTSNACTALMCLKCSCGVKVDAHDHAVRNDVSGAFRYQA